MRAIVLNGDPAEKYVPEGVEIIHGDLLDKESLERFFKNMLNRNNEEEGFLDAAKKPGTVKNGLAAN